MPFGWSLMVSLQRPLARRAETTLRPPFVRIRDRNPCSRLRGIRFGWYVRLTIVMLFSYSLSLHGTISQYNGHYT